MSKSERASPGGCHRLVHLADAPLGVGVGAFFFAPDRGGQHQVGELRGRRWMIAVLHHQEIEIRKRLPQHILIGKGDQRIGRDDPQRPNLLAHRRFDDIRIRQAALGGKPRFVDVPQRGQLLPILRVSRTCDSPACWK